MPWMKDAWVSEEERLAAIEKDEMWRIQWYPDTPIGSYSIAASDLEILLKRANEIQEEADNDVPQNGS